MITESEFNAATRAPRSTEIPDCFTLPADLGKAVKARGVAHEAWVEVEDAAVGAWMAVDEAKRADRQALVDAVAAGQDDPGAEATAKAERALVVALERVRQARAKVDKADGEVARLYKAHMPELVPQATAHARAGMDAYLEKLAQAKAIVAEATTELGGAFVGLREVRDLLAPVILYTAPTRLPEVRWNDNDHRGIFAHVRSLCADIDACAPDAAAKRAA